MSTWMYIKRVIPSNYLFINLITWWNFIKLTFELFSISGKSILNSNLLIFSARIVFVLPIFLTVWIALAGMKTSSPIWGCFDLPSISTSISPSANTTISSVLWKNLPKSFPEGLWRLQSCNLLIPSLFLIWKCHSIVSHYFSLFIILNGFFESCIFITTKKANAI